MATATWNGTVIAQSDSTEMVEGNHYFPLASVNSAYLKPSGTHSICPWKGAAWYYPEPKDAAAQIKDHIAFWKGVTVTD